MKENDTSGVPCRLTNPTARKLVQTDRGFAIAYEMLRESVLGGFCPVHVLGKLSAALAYYTAKNGGMPARTALGIAAACYENDTKQNIQANPTAAGVCVEVVRGWLLTELESGEIVLDNQRHEIVMLQSAIPRQEVLLHEVQFALQSNRAPVDFFDDAYVPQPRPEVPAQVQALERTLLPCLYDEALYEPMPFASAADAHSKTESEAIHRR